MEFLLQIVFVSALLLAVPAVLYLLGRRFAPRVFRRLAYEVHLWLGIVSGLILFVVCLSGTLLTFKTETIMFLERDRYYVDVPENARPLSLQELVPKLEEAQNGKVVRVTIPEEKNRSWIVNIRKTDKDVPKGKSERNGAAFEGGVPAEKITADEKTGEKRPDKPREMERGHARGSGGMPAGMPAIHARLGTAYLVDPYTGEILGPQRSKLYMFFMMILFLHRFLLLDIRTGQLIVGSATLIFIVLIVGGLFLWLPAKLKSGKAWMIGFKVRTGKGWSRFIYDTHNTLGFYSLIPICPVEKIKPA